MATLLIACCASAGPAFSEIAPPPPQLKEQNRPPRNALLDNLFSELAKAHNEAEGKAIETAIGQLWLQSGSPSIDILMQRGLDFFEAKNYERAFFYFNEVVILDPEYAEGWHKRATVYYVQNNYSRALADLEQVLRLEPRQYVAMGGLAVMLEELGDKKGALDVFRRALAINPWLEGAAKTEKSLSVDVEGRGI
ncbi:MAG: tetratricopeptide repeat protein [Parvibaculaceae bacterium]